MNVYFKGNVEQQLELGEQLSKMGYKNPPCYSEAYRSGCMLVKRNDGLSHGYNKLFYFFDAPVEEGDIVMTRDEILDIA